MPFYSQIIFVGTGDKSKINLWIQIRALYLVVRLRARWNFWLKFKITVNSYIFGVVIFTVSFYFPRLESDTRCDMLLRQVRWILPSIHKDTFSMRYLFFFVVMCFSNCLFVANLKGKIGGEGFLLFFNKS